MPNHIQVMLVDNQPLFRMAMLELLGTESDIAITGQATSLGELELVFTHDIDLLLLSLDLDPPPTFEYFRSFTKQFPNTRLLALVSDCEKTCVQSLLDVGVTGIVLRTESPETLINAIRLVSSGRCYLGLPDIAERLKVFCQEKPQVIFTPREQEIFNLLIQGKSNQEIANTLSLANQTVRNRLCDIYKKLDVNTRGEAILWSIKEKQSRR